MSKKNRNEVKKIRLTADYNVGKCITGKDKIMKCSIIDSSEDSTTSKKEE